MNDDFQAMIDKRRARIRELREAFDRDGYLRGVSIRNPDYSILLTRNASSDAPYRVTSFDGRRVPVGHREYDALDGAGPTRDALGEFASQDIRLVPRGSLTALCVRTRVIGTGNSFEVLIPLSEIGDKGQTYRIIRPDQGNREFVPFHLGIAPYVTEIIHMPPGGVRYERYKAHEAASKAKELSIIQHAFPENHLSELPFLWNRDYLADKQITLSIDRQGNLIRPVVPTTRPRSQSSALSQPS
jgi:hypothetical protein